MLELATHKRKIDNLRTELDQSIAILDITLHSMQEVGDIPTAETALFGLMNYLERISTDLDESSTVLFDYFQDYLTERKFA